MFLKLIERFALFLNHVSMSEREIIDSLDLLQFELIFMPLSLLILEDLIGHDKGVGLVCPIFSLINQLLAHQLTLVFKQALLVFTFLYLLKQLFVALFMDLVNDLTKHILIIRSVKVDAL